MSNKEEKAADACELAPTDSEGKTNLCCCYVLESGGGATDPCPLPTPVTGQKKAVKAE